MKNELTSKEVAELLCMDVSRVCRLARSGRLKATLHGWSWVFKRADVEAFQKIPRKSGRPKKPTFEPLLIAHFEQVGRLRATFSVKVPKQHHDDPWDWMERVLKTRGHIMSREVDFEPTQDDGLKGNVVTAFRVIGQYRLEKTVDEPRVDRGLPDSPESCP